MRSKMLSQIRFFSEFFRAYRTFKRLFFSVGARVPIDLAQDVSGIGANIAFIFFHHAAIWMLSFEMSFQFFFVSKQDFAFCAF